MISYSKTEEFHSVILGFGTNGRVRSNVKVYPTLLLKFGRLMMRPLSFVFKSHFTFYEDVDERVLSHR